jgi:hypothetical protein
MLFGDFDSAIPWFESRRSSQILSDKIKDIEAAEELAGAIFMLHRVAKISKHFQRSPICVGGSMQQAREGRPSGLAKPEMPTT